MKNREKQIKRIQEMEESYDRLLLAQGHLESALNEFSAVQKDTKKLAAYYGSGAWKQDFEDDELALLPRDLKRGVLSEDGLYDALTLHRQLMIRMLDQINEALKKNSI